MKIERYTPHVPEPTSEVSFGGLAWRLATLTIAALALKTELSTLRTRMNQDADEVSRLADLCVEAEVSPQHTEHMLQAALALRAVAEASADVEASADDMASHARATADAHETEYRGIYEVATANAARGIRQPKPGFTRTP